MKGTDDVLVAHPPWHVAWKELTVLKFYLSEQLLCSHRLLSRAMDRVSPWNWNTVKPSTL